MDETTAKILIALFTVVGSGIVSAIVNHLMTRSHNQRVFLREKAETLYLAANEFSLAVSIYTLTHFDLLNGKINYNDMIALQSKSEDGNKNQYSFANMTMIVDIYFPSTRPALDNILKARDDYQRAVNVIRAYWFEHGNADYPDLKLRFQAVAFEYDKSIQDLKAEIVKAARLQSGVKQ